MVIISKAEIETGFCFFRLESELIQMRMSSLFLSLNVTKEDVKFFEIQSGFLED